MHFSRGIMFPRTAFIFCCLSAVLVSGETYGAPQWGANAPGRKQALENLKGTIAAPGLEEPRLVTSKKDGALIFLGASPKNLIPPPATKGVRQANDVARQFVKDNGPLFHEDDPKIDFAVIREKSADDRHYVRMKQTYGGLPVFGAETMVQFSKSESAIQAVASDIMRMPSDVEATTLSLTPSITLDQAKAEVLKGWQYRHEGIELTVNGTELMVYCPEVIGNNGSARLVWSLEVRSVKGGLVGDAGLVDAHSGIVAFEYPLLHNAVNRRIYDAGNTSADPGTLARSEGQAPSAVLDVNLAYDYFGDTFDFYFNEHQRDSLNNAGGILSATVRYCEPGYACPYENAFWDGTSMYFGEGYAAADDVIAHELTHGVTDYESALIYANQSGAINESFSDMWGEWIDQTNGAGNDTPPAKWLIGEDLPIGAIRNMSNPTQFSDPDRMNSPHWYWGLDDNGGVHWNSGVGNKLCYLLTDGGSFNGKIISGFGLSKTAKLFYEVQSNLLTAGSDYLDLYNNLKQAAINLGFSLEDRDNLEQACQAVEIHLGFGAYPDLSTVGAQSLVKKGKIQVSIGVANTGTGISDKTTADVYFTPDGTWFNATLVKSFKISKLKPQKVKTLKVKNKVASNWMGGYLLLDMDPMGLVNESVEDNNAILFGPL